VAFPQRPEDLRSVVADGEEAHDLDACAVELLRDEGRIRIDHLADQKLVADRENERFHGGG
jgi:hypothetical protein